MLDQRPYGFSTQKLDLTIQDESVISGSGVKNYGGVVW